MGKHGRCFDDGVLANFRCCFLMKSAWIREGVQSILV